MDGFLDIMLAALLGAAVGAEREWRRHPAGLRTCAIVAAAAACFASLMLQVGGNNPAAGLGSLATGVGFLGAGVILHRRGDVHGLPTAATFWAVAGMGAAVGTRHYGAGLALGAVVMLSHLVLRGASAWIDRRAPPPGPGPH